MTVVTEEDILNPDTSMGAVTVRVGDLEAMSGYYLRAFGIEPIAERSRDREYLDAHAYLQRHLTQAAVDAGSSLAGRVGHVHLQVGDLDTARAFYVEALGFETTQTDYAGALFASAGRYHHHIAMNTWNSRGTGPRAASLGLGDDAVTVPSVTDRDALIARLGARSIPFVADGRSAVVTDPCSTQVTIALPDLSTDELVAR